jgi:hypothetical protein
MNNCVCVCVCVCVFVCVCVCVCGHRVSMFQLLSDFDVCLCCLREIGVNLLWLNLNSHIIYQKKCIDFITLKMLWAGPSVRRGLRRRSAVTRLLRLWVRIPPESWMFVCCQFCVLSGRGLWCKMITRLVESCQLWCIIVCDLETSWMRRPWPTGGSHAKNKTNKNYVNLGVLSKPVPENMIL